MIKLVILLAGCGCVVASAAHAQALPPWMRVQGAHLAEHQVSGNSSTGTPSVSAPGEAHIDEGSIVAARFRQTRARRILAAGVGLMVSGAVTPAYVLPHRQPCHGSDDRKGGAPLKGAAGIGAVGMAAAVGGAAWSSLEANRHGYRSSRRQRLVGAGIGTLTFLVGQLVLGSVFFVDQICHT